jgi:putative tryptophan/tyrosine transport system substrate-binding protein
MKRREFITLLGGAATAWPLAMRAQQLPSAMPVVGFLNSASPDAFAHLAQAFRDGMREMGYTESKNVAVEYRWAEGRFDTLPDLAVNLVGRQVAAIVATGGEPSALAAKRATQSIPIIFLMGENPIEAGLVASFNRPGGNVTGITLFAFAAVGKRTELAHELIPRSAAIALLLNSRSPIITESERRSVETTAAALGRKIQNLYAGSESEIEAAFQAATQQRIGAVIVSGDAFFTNRRNQIVALAAHHAMPAI